MRGQRPCRKMFTRARRGAANARDRSRAFEKPVGWARFDGGLRGETRVARPGRAAGVPDDECALAQHLEQGDLTEGRGGHTLFLHLWSRGRSAGGSLSEKAWERSPRGGDSRRCAEKACPRFRRSRGVGSAGRGSRIRGRRTHLETRLLQRHESARASLPGLVHLAVGALPNLLQLFIRLVDGVPHRDGLPTSRSVRRCASVSRGPRCVCVRDKERPMREACGRSSVRSGRSAARGRRRSARPRFSSSRARVNSGVPAKARLTECPYASRVSDAKNGGNRLRLSVAAFKRFSRTGVRDLVRHETRSDRRRDGSIKCHRGRPRAHRTARAREG